MCILDAGRPVPASIRDISARGAFLETNERLALGASATLRHPEAGVIDGQVSGALRDGILIAFAGDAHSAGFALAVIAADMSRPPEAG